jgi:rhodanese-related sulfurtransferase
VIARTFREAAALLLFALLPAIVFGAVRVKWRGAEPLAKDEVTLATVEGWNKPVQWVDARPRAKFDAGHAPDAVLLNEDEWNALIPAFLDKWDPDRPVVVYCDGGACDASHAVAKRLREDLQLENIWVLKGGWDAWQRK